MLAPNNFVGVFYDSNFLGAIVLGSAPLEDASFPLHLGAVSDTYSSLHSSIGTPLKATSFLPSAMCDTNSSLLSLIGTSLVTTSFSLHHVCAVCPTYSSPHRSIFTSFEAASFLLHLGTMRYAYPTLHGLICASLLAATFCLCGMGATNSSLHGSIGTSLKAALFLLSAMRDANSSLFNLIGTSFILHCLILAPCVTQTPPFRA
jgi:hypothetical protein